MKLARLSSKKAAVRNIAPLHHGHGAVARRAAEKEAVPAAAFLPPTAIGCALRPRCFAPATDEPRLKGSHSPPPKSCKHRSSSKSASGPDDIPWRMLTILTTRWEGFIELLVSLHIACALYVGTYPRCFQQATFEVLRKPNKLVYGKQGADRPISFLPTLGKLSEGLIAARNLAKAEQNPRIVLASHYGGRHGRSTKYAVIRVHEFIRNAQRN